MAIEKFELKFSQSRANLYHVPLKQWNKWSIHAKQVFNEVYSSMIKSQVIFKHPKQERVSKTHWKTVCWNASWTAATACDNQSFKGGFLPVPDRLRRMEQGLDS